MSSRAAASVTAVVAAAGSGERLGAGVPKAFVPLAGRPLVEWSIDAFRRVAGVRSIVVACPPGHAHDLGDSEAASPEWDSDGLSVVDGGATRAESVANALEAVDTELVAIHDAARPLVMAELIEGVVATLVADERADGVIAATPVTDTIKRVTSGEPEQSGEVQATRSTLTTHNVVNVDRVIEGTVDRNQLWAAQTPQAFRAETLRRALAAYPADAPPATDEAMLIEAAGGRVLIHPASPENLKVTTPLHLRVAEALLRDREGTAG